MYLGLPVQLDLILAQIKNGPTRHRIRSKKLEPFNSKQIYNSSGFSTGSLICYVLHKHATCFSTMTRRTSFHLLITSLSLPSNIFRARRNAIQTHHFTSITRSICHSCIAKCSTKKPYYSSSFSYCYLFVISLSMQRL